MAPIPVDNEGEFELEIRDAQHAHLMKIESFSKLWKRGLDKHESSKFDAGTYKWNLIFYPKGTGISVFLSVAETETLPEGWEVTADCSILLHNQNSDNYFCFRGKARRFDAENSRWGFSISGRMLAGACNGEDNCSFGAEVILGRTEVNECLSLHDWKISGFSNLKDKWTSEDFLAGGFRWKVKLYPNGRGDAKGKSVSIYLERVDSETGPREKVQADFCIRIKSQLPPQASKRKSHSWFSSKTVDSGFRNFIPIADMRDPSKGFIIKDCCFLEVDITVYKPII